MGIGFGLNLSLYRSIITNLAPPSLRGGLVSLAESAGRISSTLTPILMGAGIAIAAQWLAFDASIQVVGVGTGVVAAGVGIVSLFVANTSLPIQDNE